MKEWWNNLSIRERQVVFFGSIAIFLILIYLILWQPFTNKIDNLRSQITKNKNLLIWMQSADKQMQTIVKESQTKTSKNNGSILGVVQSDINKSALKSNLTQLKQAENDTVQVTFQKVGFDNLMKWLIHLWQQDGLTVLQATITPGDSLGVVSADLILA